MLAVFTEGFFFCSWSPALGRAGVSLLWRPPFVSAGHRRRWDTTSLALTGFWFAFFFCTGFSSAQRVALWFVEETDLSGAAASFSAATVGFSFSFCFFFLFEDRGRSGRLVGWQETRGQTRITEPGSVFDEACAFLESGSRRRPTRAAAGVFGSTFSLTFQPHCLVNDVVGRETRLDAAATPAGPPSTPAPPHEQPHRPRAAMGCDSDRWLAAIRIAFHWQPVERLSTRPVRRIAVRQQKKKRRKETTERSSLNNDGLRLGLATPRHPRYERKRKGRVAPRRLCRERPTTRPRPAPVIAVRRLGAGPQPSDAGRVQRRWR